MSEPSSPATRCPRCGAVFYCTPGAECWCARLPFRPMPEGAASCLCPSCLASDRREDGRRLARPGER